GNALQKLAAYGQSCWLDDLSRGMMTKGDLSRFVAEGVCGVTANPASPWPERLHPAQITRLTFNTPPQRAAAHPRFTTLCLHQMFAGHGTSFGRYMSKAGVRMGLSAWRSRQSWPMTPVNQSPRQNASGRRSTGRTCSSKFRLCRIGMIQSLAEGKPSKVPR